MTLTEVTTDFTWGAALGAASPPECTALGSGLGCLLGNAGALPSSRPGQPSAIPAPRPLLLLDHCHHPAEPHGEKPSEAPKGLMLFYY